MASQRCSSKQGSVSTPSTTPVPRGSMMRGNPISLSKPRAIKISQAPKKIKQQNKKIPSQTVTAFRTHKQLNEQLEEVTTQIGSTNKTPRPCNTIQQIPTRKNCLNTHRAYYQVSVTAVRQADETSIDEVRERLVHHPVVLSELMGFKQNMAQLRDGAAKCFEWANDIPTVYRCNKGDMEHVFRTYTSC